MELEVVISFDSRLKYFNWNMAMSSDWFHINLLSREY